MEAKKRRGQQRWVGWMASQIQCMNSGRWEAWCPVVHGAAKSPTWLSNRATTTNKGRDEFSGWTPEYYNMLILPQLDFLIPQLGFSAVLIKLGWTFLKNKLTSLIPTFIGDFIDLILLCSCFLFSLQKESFKNLNYTDF